MLKQHYEVLTIIFSNENNLWFSNGGSFSNTSIPAPRIFLFFKASYKAFSLIIPPLAVLIKIDFF